jgi:transcriptional regulator GlxA family with amidase domain
MNARLANIQEWAELARQARWSVVKLAELCGVSERTLRRYFQENRRQGPKAWLAAQRHMQAIELLRDGSSVKETALEVGYQNPETFSREFKKHWGQCPFEMAHKSTASPVFGDKCPEKLCHFTFNATKL